MKLSVPGSAPGGADGDVMEAVARLPATADRGALIATLERSVADLLKRLSPHRGRGGAPDELFRQAQKTLEFLEACSDINDDAFKRVARSRAEAIRAAIGAIPGPDPGTPTPVSTAAEPPSASGEQGPPPSFASAFVSGLVAFFRRRLDPLRVDVPSPQPLPFLLAPGFADSFAAAVRACIAPSLLKSRKVQLLEQSMGAADLVDERFIEILEGPAKGNAVRLLWEDRFAGFIAALGEDGSSPPAGAPVPGVNPGNGLAADAGRFLGILADGATKGGYLAPEARDLALFRGLFDWAPERIEGAVRAVDQLLRQEVSEGVGREGGTVDYLNGMVAKSAPHLGEFVVLWAHLARGDLFTPPMVKSFLGSQGTTPEARRRALPYLLRFIPDYVTTLPGDAS